MFWHKDTLEVLSHPDIGTTLEEHDPAANEWVNTKPSEHIIQSAIYVHQMTVRIWVDDLIWI